MSKAEPSIDELKRSKSILQVAIVILLIVLFIACDYYFTTLGKLRDLEQSKDKYNVDDISEIYDIGYSDAVNDLYNEYGYDFGYFIGYSDAASGEDHKTDYLNHFFYEDDPGNYLQDGYEDGYSDGTP